jgi:hypothetical protein
MMLSMDFVLLYSLNLSFARYIVERTEFLCYPNFSNIAEVVQRVSAEVEQAKSERTEMIRNTKLRHDIVPCTQQEAELMTIMERKEEAIRQHEICQQTWAEVERRAEESRARYAAEEEARALAIAAQEADIAERKRLAAERREECIRLAVEERARIIERPAKLEERLRILMEEKERRAACLRSSQKSNFWCAKCAVA